MQAYNKKSINIQLPEEDIEYLEYIASTSNFSITRLLEPSIKEVIRKYKKIDEERRNKLYKEGYGPVIW